LQGSPFVQTAFAVGDGFRFLTALIVPHRAHLEEFARSEGIAFDRFEQILEAPEVLARFHQELTSLQAGIAPFEQVKRFCFLPEEALLDPELMTPTQKVRRSVLHQRYSRWIQKMYSQEEPPAIVIPQFSRSEPLERAQVQR
jgi:long-chain acyl-CoA synthetase